ncbi:MAG: hypothetical protein CMF22_10050 [Idiomarinaceae bacterium]|nr:hypothetical protein [Idiomarinaceae bacterium]MBG23783.1 hypothetical protein [Idiomarinaceae bacterium]|tara:strand:+ start:56876 stop:57646 length:771 start_codon:yes stop_codon:yes gene_type:complete
MSVEDKVEKNFSDKDLRGLYYVYVLSHNGVPFYVGKGKGDRWRHHFYDHCEESSRKSNPYKFYKINKILHSGDKISVSIEYTTTSEQDCLEEELRLIHLHGRKCDGGTLTNFKIENGESVSIRDVWSGERVNQYRSRMTDEHGWADPELVKQAKLLYHYRGLDSVQISEMGEFSTFHSGTIRQWILHGNGIFDYVCPHLNDKSGLINEKRTEALNLYLNSSFSKRQVAKILGLSQGFIQRSLSGIVREEQGAGGTS